DRARAAGRRAPREGLMLSEILFGARSAFKPFNVFHYITFRSALGALFAFLVCYFVIPSWIEMFRARGLGQVIRTDGPQSHKPKAGTPTMGGLVALLAIALGIIL